MSDCRYIATLLDDYVDDAIDSANDHAVEAHLAKCAVCRADADAMRSLVQAARALPKVMGSDRDLWPGIAARLETAPRSRLRWRPWLAVAAMLVAVTSAWWLGRWSAEPVPTPAPSADPDAAFASFDAEDGFREDYQRARAELDALLAQRRGRMSAENLRIVEESLALIDRAIEDIDAALVDNPNDPNLNRSLRLAYARQLDVLETATRWTLQS